MEIPESAIDAALNLELSCIYNHDVSRDDVRDMLEAALPLILDNAEKQSR